MNTTIKQAADGAALAGLDDRWRRFVNTFLSFPFLFDLVISQGQYDALLQRTIARGSVEIGQRALERLLWFWPRIIDARVWAEGGSEKLQCPENFVSIDVPSRVLCDAVASYAQDKGAPILDLGCNVGRHLAMLHAKGFTKLTGVDAMAAALSQMKERFPEMHASARIHHDLFQRFLPRQVERSFDVVYTHGATIELVHPSFDIVRYLCRAASNFVILIHNEVDRALYPRFWYHQFARNGFYLREAKRPIGAVEPGGRWERTSLVVFQRFR